jgi:hypothetical protein
MKHIVQITNEQFGKCDLIERFFVNAKELGPCRLELCKQEGSNTEVSILSKQEKNKQEKNIIYMLVVNKLEPCTPEPCRSEPCRPVRNKTEPCTKGPMDCHKPPPRRQPRSEVHHRHLVKQILKKQKQKVKQDPNRKKRSTYFTSVFHGVSFS